MNGRDDVYVLRYNDEILRPTVDDALALLDAILSDYEDEIAKDPEAFAAALSAELLEAIPGDKAGP